ncbi:type III-B CRISPR module RAMP protein Cmr6 [Desulfofundulus thermobenzoicus]|uniref:Type III-B CRISPR module RAMP protein Cmr6 n=1 Tax=Desulfofundulus thermobenzoicus TaxID=29376 RepID=A0A6N7IU14_9FIRM|nr:type III-B CRISPR module RAMP protein Cmr6 [Desulfofundulus thermobenzoicus]MQL53401.1 type III-B CRISPR module RAMP protein Cmr6 [Desulfofundulus thermobenzoicus]HHW44415.1 type III-B CRISPR module RAMP protein Cmr6 [Desulfotomaculum sp.]
MVRPLYAGNRAPDNFRAEFNAGLWYDKFCNRWLPKKREWSLESNGKNGKKEWIDQLNDKKVGSPAYLEMMIDRMGRLVTALKGELRCFATDWRFVTGLGREHPVENGFAWHHLLGVPFLPGSSVKGVVRAWAENWVGVEPNEVRRIFGPPGWIDEKRVGSVLFFDALPAGPVKVQADVMTPHYAPYYQPQGVPQPPGDWFDPVPIPFLTVAPGQPFLFAIAPRRPECSQDRRDCVLALEWLEEALAGIGAGAKTAVGYGRFTRRLDLEERWSARWPKSETGVKGDEPLDGDAGEGVSPELATSIPEPVSAIRAAMEQDGYSSNPEQFMHALTTKWLPRMQNVDTEVADRREIAQLLAEWYQKTKPDQWKKPNKKNTSKIEAIKRTMDI